jgi:hypothetical protein
LAVRRDDGPLALRAAALHVCRVKFLIESGINRNSCFWNRSHFVRDTSRSCGAKNRTQTRIREVFHIHLQPCKNNPTPFPAPFSF